MKRKSLARVAAAWMALAAVGSHSAASAQEAALARCVPVKQAEGLFLTIFPALLREMQRICAPALAPGAMLRELPPAYIGPFEAQADAAWPLAAQAMATMSGVDLGGAGEALVRPMLESTIGPMVLAEFQAKDCPSAEKILVGLEPLPPRNLALVAVAILQIRGEPVKGAETGGETEDDGPGFAVCADA